MAETTAAPIDRILQHIKYLSVDIGPRGSTTEGERKGAEYCQAEMQRAGLAPVTERFRSAKSIFLPHLIGSGLFLAAFILYPTGGRVTAFIAFLVSAISLASELLELGFIDNPFRWIIPKGTSQNVVGIIPAEAEHRQDLVLIGHIDTQRTPLVFSTPRWVEVYKNFTTVAFVLFSLQVVLYLGGWATGWGWIWPVSGVSAAGAALLALLCIQADLTPFTAGANDNASSVGMVLTLAEQLSQHPLKHTRVFSVCTGCEEVQHYGAIDFFKRHRAEMVRPRGLVFELLGCAGPAYLEKEGIIVPFHSDPELVRLVKEAGAQGSAKPPYPVSISGGNSEMADCVRFKVPAISIFGLKPDGEAPYWHQAGDTFDKMNPAVLRDTYQLVWQAIQCLDQEAG